MKETGGAQEFCENQPSLQLVHEGMVEHQHSALFCLEKKRRGKIQLKPVIKLCHPTKIASLCSYSIKVTQRKIIGEDRL